MKNLRKYVIFCAVLIFPVFCYANKSFKEIEVLKFDNGSIFVCDANEQKSNCMERYKEFKAKYGYDIFYSSSTGNLYLERQNRLVTLCSKNQTIDACIQNAVQIEKRKKSAKEAERIAGPIMNAMYKGFVGGIVGGIIAILVGLFSKKHRKKLTETKNLGFKTAIFIAVIYELFLIYALLNNIGPIIEYQGEYMDFHHFLIFSLFGLTPFIIRGLSIKFKIDKLLQKLFVFIKKHIIDIFLLGFSK